MVCSMSEVKRPELSKDLLHYRKCLDILGCDMSIDVLCLPKTIQTILVKQGYTRIFDIMSQDFSEIKGIGERRGNILVERLSQFLPMTF